MRNPDFPQTELFEFIRFGGTHYQSIPFGTLRYMCQQSKHLILSHPLFTTSVRRYIAVKDIWEFYVIMAKMNSIEFITIKIQREDKDAYDAWCEEYGDDLLNHLSNTADAGYKLSMSYDFENGTYIVALTGKKDTPKNGGLCFTSRSKDLVDALLLTLYKHWGLANGGDWSKIATSTDDWG